MTEQEERKIWSYLDGELAYAERRAFEAECEDDRELATHRDRLREIDTALRAAYPPHAFTRPTAMAVRPKARGVRRAAAAAAAVVLLTGLAWAAVETYDQFAVGGNEPKDNVSGLESTAGEPDEGSPVQQEDTTEPDASPSIASEALAQATADRETGEARTLRGVVVDVNGQGIPNATVRGEREIPSLGPDTKYATIATARTNGAGKFDVGYRGEVARWTVEKGGYARLNTNLSGLGLPEAELQAVLPPLVDMTGIVTDEGGRPIAGVDVTLPDREGSARATTDADGRFSIPVSAFSEEEKLRFYRHEYAPRVAVRPVDHPVRITLRRGGELRVIAKRGSQPVEGVQIYAVQIGSMVTNDRGEAVFPAVHAPNGVEIAALTENGELVPVKDEPILVDDNSSARVTVEIPVADALTVSGLVTDRAGNPYAGGMVLALRKEGAEDQPEYQKFTVTDDTGRYSMELPSGDYMLVAQPKSLQSPLDRGVAVLDNVRGAVEREITLREERWSTRVRLTYPEGGKPSALSLYPRLPEDEVVKMIIPAAESWTVPGYRSWENDVLLTAPERGLASNVVVEESDSTQEENINLFARVFDLPLVRYVYGRIVDPGGAPVSMAYVKLSGSHVGWFAAVTDAEGWYHFEGVPADSNYRVTVRRHGFENLSYSGVTFSAVSDGQRIPDITIRPASVTIDGSVLWHTGRPVEEANVNARLDDKKLAGVVTDRFGRFTLNVAEDEYLLQANLGNEYSDVVPVQSPVDGVVLYLYDWSADVSNSGPPEGNDAREAEDALKQMGLVFKMFASEHRDKFPELIRQYGRFIPEPSALYPDYVTGDELYARLLNETSVKWAYTGYTLTNINTATAFLDAYEEYGPDELNGQDFKVEPGYGVGGSDTMFRLREGIERFMITDINDTGAAQSAQSSIPVMWEMPASREENGGYVLYLDGHVEWVAYPSKFPMVEPFIERLQGIMDRAKAPAGP